MLPQFLHPIEKYDVANMISNWNWLVPNTETPLFISVFGDWVFGSPNGNLCCLSVLEGNYEVIAKDSNEYNRLNKSVEWLDKIFILGWQEIAYRHGIIPGDNECIGWKVHPLIGGKFVKENLQIFDMTVYQALMGQLHRQLRNM